MPILSTEKEKHLDFAQFEEVRDQALRFKLKKANICNKRNLSDIMENENERKWNISVLQPQETTEDYKDSSAGYTEPLPRGNLLKVSTFDSNQPESQIKEYTEFDRSNTNESLMRQDSLETQLAYQS